MCATLQCMSRSEPVTLQQLVANLSPLEIRVDTIEALRQWRRKHRALREFNVQTNLATEFMLVVGKRKNVQLPGGSTFTNLCGEFTSSNSEALVRDAFETVWWLVRCGFAIPLGIGNADFPLYYRLTRRGERFLDEDDDHPLLPGYLERIEAKCPGLPKGVIPILEEARKCLDYSLLRSGVVLMGVAYEIMLDEIANVLTTKGLATSGTPTQDASTKIKRIKAAFMHAAMPTVLPTAEDRTAAEAALDFADKLRAERNRGAHTAKEFDNGGEAEEFLVSAGRHLVAIWKLAI